jgi:molybdopterin molybdotransferase
MSGFFDVRMRGFKDRVDVDEVVRIITQHVGALSAETAPLHEAAGRALAREAVAACDVPGFDRAAMDGYAVRGEETFGAGPYSPLILRITGEALPGKPHAGQVGPGEAVRIMTGAPLPRGADAVLPFEMAREEAGGVAVLESVPPGKHVSRRGEDVAAGSVLFQAGRVLRPQDVGLLASAGVGNVFLPRIPKVSILVTGDELLPPGSIPQGCQIIDSNSLMLAALARRDGGEPDVAGIVADRRDAVREGLLMADGDLVLVSGGSSVGREDHAPAVLADEGDLLVHGVALRPASPTGFGILRGRPVFLLPGNPVSCLCAYDLFAGLALRRMVGRPAGLPYVRGRYPLGAKVASALGRVDYVRVRLEDGKAVPIAVSGASILSTATRADGFVLVPQGLEGYPEGAEVEVHLYGGQP